MVSIIFKTLIIGYIFASQLTVSVFADSFDSRCVKALSIVKENIPSDVTNGESLYNMLDPESDFLCEHSDKSDIISISIPILTDDVQKVITSDVNVRSESINSLVITCNHE